MKIVEYRNAIKAWHFLPADGCLANSKRKRPVTVGKIFSVKPPIAPCSHGLHGSIRIIDALAYAPGPIVCRTLHWGEVVEHGSDKIASQKRKAIAIADASTMLHIFACDVAQEALDAIPSGRVDPRSRSAIETKRRWIAGEASDKELSAARCAAEHAARSAAQSAARYAAQSAAWFAAWCAAQSAARSAVWYAAQSAAWFAAWCAAQSAARSAAESAQNDRLEKIAFELLGINE